MVKPRNEGFSLIEMMIAFSIIFITMGLMLPGLYSGSRKAERIKCANNLKQAAQVLNLWAADHKKMPESFDQLAEEGLIDNLDLFKCSVSGRKSDWEYEAAGVNVNKLKATDKLIHCKHCNLDVYSDGHVKFLKPRQRGGD